MSNTPVVTSGDVNVRVASHLSKLPSIATDAFTKNLTVLASGVITKTGAVCAWLTEVISASIPASASNPLDMTVIVRLHLLDLVRSPNWDVIAETSRMQLSE